MSSRRCVSAVPAIVCMLLLSATSWGQPRQNGVGGPPARPEGARPNGLIDPQQPQQMPMNGGFQQTYYPELYDYGTGYPGIEVRAVPGAMVNRAIARAEYRRLQSGLDQMIRNMRMTFERSRDYAAAAMEERQAFEQLEAARREALQSVVNDPAYQASVSLRQSVSDQIDHTRQSRYSTTDEILAMARVKMDYASTASAMEAAALAASPDVQQARERLLRASAVLSDLRQQFSMDVRTNEDIEMTRRNLQDARIAKLAAEVHYTGVREARDIALNYAHYTRRYDKYKYLSYGYYGYNHPYGVGAGYRGGYPIGYPNRWRD
jgi:hypothetical protein